MMCSNAIRETGAKQSRPVSLPFSSGRRKRIRPLGKSPVRDAEKVGDEVPDAHEPRHVDPPVEPEGVDLHVRGAVRVVDKLQRGRRVVEAQAAALGVDDEYADQKEQRERGAEKGNQKRAGAETAVYGTELLFSFSVPSMPAPRRAYSARSFRTARIVSPSSRPEYCASLSVFTSVPTSTRTEACVACML